MIPDGSGGRELELNEGVVTHSAWRPDTVLTGRYWDLFLLLPPLLPQPPRSMLVIGNAGIDAARILDASDERHIVVDLTRGQLRGQFRPALLTTA